MSLGGSARSVAGVDPRTVADVMRLDFVSGTPEDLGPGRIAVSRSTAQQNGISTGAHVKTAIGPSSGTDDDTRPYTVVGIYEDNPTAGDILADRADVQRHSFLPGSVQRVLVAADGPASSADLAKHLRTAVGNSPLLKVQDRTQLVREQAGTAGELMTMVFGLLALGVGISALGMINTLAMSVTERTREIGVLRAIGMDRAGIRRMIRLESLTIAAFGTLLGLAGGLFGAWRVSGLANGAIPQYSFALPWGTLALVAVLSLAVGVAAAAVPARRAAALGPLQAVAEA
jgi:putative ABC transport system permease protein